MLIKVSTDLLNGDVKNFVGMIKFLFLLILFSISLVQATLLSLACSILIQSIQDQDPKQFYHQYLNETNNHPKVEGFHYV